MVVHPLQSIDENMRRTLSSVAGIPKIDIKVHMQPNGYYMLCKSTDRNRLEDVLHQIQKINVTATIFDESNLFYAPPMQKVCSARVGNNAISFVDSRNETAFVCKRHERILAVFSEVDIYKKRPYVHTLLKSAYRNPSQGGIAGRSYREKSQAQTLIPDTVPICILFNLTRLFCLELVLSDFDFSGIPGVEYQASVFKNFDTLSGHLQKLCMYTPDLRYHYSFLPLSHEHDYSKGLAETTDRHLNLKKKRSSIDNLEMEKFHCYARFRYIMEAFVFTESPGIERL